ncbi:extracellular solute-binding protein [Paenibacillus sp. LHD-117]|uniref:extracellular solute-binding protein n=1 Tax=Paenibacillus sp. LHD-117 TaxID=3071412 RepID=UPI0027E1DCC9|nr:extracellular solute-binding protein [Paenibacillus sp. LHD-117]MDQ6421471.1 extracellular solute-binding protein [Paenibacillus sp. LHD-117]
MRKSTYRAAAILLLSLVLGACSSSAPDTDVDSADAADPVVIRVFAQQEPSSDLATNDFTKELEGRFNVKFAWEAVASAGAKEKRQISFASGDYPDAYILTTYVDQFSQADVLRYGQQSVFLPLNDLIDEYAPHIKAAMKENATLRAFNTAPDGNIYGLVGYSECYHCSYPNKMWINTAWLEKLNLDMPETTEQFKEVLRAFKTLDPNGNGAADEIPLSGSIEDFGVRLIPYLMNGFIYDDDRTYLELKDGKVRMAADQPEWREGLAYIKSLYDEGLIDPGAFTQNAVAFKQIGENAGEQILGAGAAMHPDIFVNTGLGNTRGNDYNPLPPLRGPYASYATNMHIGVTPGAKFVITNKASKEAQIALIRMVDYMYTPEGQAFAETGKEGVDWRKPLPGEQALNPELEPRFARIPVESGKKSNNSGWSGMGHFYMPRDYRDSWVQGADIYAPDGYERRLMEATKLYDGHEPEQALAVESLWIQPEAADEINFLQLHIRNYIEESALQFITGNKQLDKDWEAYVNGLRKLNADRYVQIMQKAYEDSTR